MKKYLNTDSLEFLGVSEISNINDFNGNNLVITEDVDVELTLAEDEALDVTIFTNGNRLRLSSERGTSIRGGTTFPQKTKLRITRGVNSEAFAVQSSPSDLTLIDFGGGSLEVKTTYPVTTPEEAGTRFWYKGNEWHYMTQAEIDSTGWNGLVEVGFPAPVRKIFDLDLLWGSPSYRYGFGSQGSFGLSNPLSQDAIFVDFLGLGKPDLPKNLLSIWGNSTINGFKNAHLLVGLEDQGTAPSLSFGGGSYTITDVILNELLTQLPPTTKTATINLTNTTGSATCDPTIATAKGYTVIT